MYKKLGYNKESLGHVYKNDYILDECRSAWFLVATRISWINFGDRISHIFPDKSLCEFRQ